MFLSDAKPSITQSRGATFSFQQFCYLSCLAELKGKVSPADNV